MPANKPNSSIPVSASHRSFAAVIFDMDGVLIDSEPYWQQAQLEIFPNYGVPLTRADTITTKGLRIDQVVQHWHQRYPWGSQAPQKQAAEIQWVAQQIVQRVEQLIRTEGRPLNGVQQALIHLQQQGIPMALATSSPQSLIDATLTRLQLHQYFQAVCSAEQLPYGKPHPQVYLDAAAALSIAPISCLAIEDSLNGVIAAKAAGMQVIAIPEPDQRHDPRFSIADHTLLDLTQWQRFFD
ncbi:MAG: hexitol phosphatase HxpB [Ferrimonas sp.]